MPPAVPPTAAAPRGLLLGMCAIFVAAPAPSLAETSPAAELSVFHGAWQRVAVEEDDKNRLSAIDSAVAGLSWLTRKMAAPILRATTSPPALYEFVVSEPALLFAERGEPPQPLPLDGTERRGEGPRGEFSAHSRLIDGAIETEWIVADARGSNRYTLTDGGETLLVEHSIEVTALEGVEKFAYQTRFQRTPAVASAGPPDEVARDAALD